MRGTLFNNHNFGNLNELIRWTYHLSAATNDTTCFEKAKRYLLEFKSLSKMGGEVEDYVKDGELVEIKDCSNFSKLCEERYFREDTCINEMAHRALDDDLYINKWSSDLQVAL
jgi:hypothetical protein